VQDPRLVCIRVSKIEGDIRLDFERNIQPRLIQSADLDEVIIRREVKFSSALTSKRALIKRKSEFVIGMTHKWLVGGGSYARCDSGMIAAMRKIAHFQDLRGHRSLAGKKLSRNGDTISHQVK
jgi:hypothetical protein